VLMCGAACCGSGLISKTPLVCKQCACCGAFSGGSLVQLCLDDKVSQMAGQAANFTCRARVAHKQCRW
jgi:hypothetical protein